MSIYDKASLVLIPSGTKTSKVYSQKPVNGDGDFTFSRSTAATRVNADGNIEKETQNLLLQSNSFDTTWSTSNASVTGGQSGYDGSSDAWLLSKSGANGRVQQFLSKSGVQTFSVYAKSNTATWLKLQAWNGSSFYTTSFNLSSGALGSLSNLIDANTEDIGEGGWYRCSISLDASIQLLYIYPAAGDNDTAATSGSIYIQDAQLEQGLVARDYIETTTAAVEGGITDNVPRLDYTDSSCPALLLEPQRTNRVEYSEYGGSSYWSKSNSIITNNAATSPEGLDNAFELTDNTSNGYHWIYKSGVASVPDHRISFFAKANTLSQVWSNGGSGSNSAGFDLSNGTIAKESGNANAKIEDYGNGWYRCSFTSDANGILIATMKNNNETYAGTGQSIYMYGIQSEQEASYATSYIPTYGTSVTRNADSCLKTGISSLIGQTEGTMYAEFEWEQKSGVYFVSDLSDGSGSNEIYIGVGNSNNNLVRFFIINGGVTQMSFNSSAISSGTHKVALAYANNDVVAYLDGVQVNTDSSATIPATNQFKFERANGTLGFVGGMKQSLLFKTRLSNEELADLTTL